MSHSPNRLVIALGGNTISVRGEEGTIDQQFTHTKQTAEVLCDIIECGYQPVITHGNGPQVGNILRRVEIASTELYPIPLEVCVADTQAGMGYMIAQCLINALTFRGLESDVTPIVTTVLVDQDDPAFDRPTKPIGAWMTAEDAKSHRINDGWHMQQVADGRYRRIVPSPHPQKILELPAIRTLVESGQIVVTCGGGGIPVFQDAAGTYAGAAAVIDKDWTTALLARQLDAATVVFLTAVEHASIEFGTPAEQALHVLSVDEARAYVTEGQFASGSMQPKMEAAIDYVSKSPHNDPVAIITDLNHLTTALDGKGGTRIART